MENKKVKFNIGYIIVFVYILIAIIGLFYTPYDAYAMIGNMKMQPPSSMHFFGTDNFGRDIFSRTIIGIRYTLAFSGIALLGSGIIGVSIGLICVRVNRYIDQIIIRVIDTINSIPPILLALVLMSIFKGNAPLLVSLTVIFIPMFVRITRNEAMQIRELEFIQRAELIGASSFRIIIKHILPNLYPSLISTSILVITNTIMVESSLSYLGVGIQPPVPSLGRMLYDAQSILINAPWAAIIPGCCIVILIVGLNYLGRNRQ